MLEPYAVKTASTVLREVFKIFRWFFINLLFYFLLVFFPLLVAVFFARILFKSLVTLFVAILLEVATELTVPSLLRSNTSLKSESAF